MFTERERGSSGDEEDDEAILDGWKRERGQMDVKVRKRKTIVEASSQEYMLREIKRAT